MATKPFKWQTAPTGTEGVNTVYAHEAGSDLFGDGTRANPYQSLGKAYRFNATRPTRIICIGRFSEMLADGNHACNIDGDYYGAATFDGADYYLMYGFRHNKMMIKNTGLGTYDMVVHTGSEALAGVGGATPASAVGSAINVIGVAGSPVLLHKASLYWGVIGGTTAVQYCIFSRLKQNDTHKLSLGAYGSLTRMTHLTVYGSTIADRKKRITQFAAIYSSSIFAAFDLFADDYNDFDTCLFLADCKWYYNGSEIVLSGATSEARLLSLTNAMDTLAIPEASRPKFVNCKFSLQTSAQVFNNAERQDFTLKHESDAVINDVTYYGALPPALNIPIMDDSSGVAATWDEASCSGHIAVTGNSIVLNEASSDVAGEILSKVIKIDPSKINISAIFAAFESKFMDYQTYLWDRDLFGASYGPGVVLPIGRYMVKGAVVYNNLNIGNNAVVVVTAENTTFANDGIPSTLIELLDANASNVCYVRTSAAVYKMIKATDGLQRNGVYINLGVSNITYRSRTIVPGESFVAVNDVDTFTGPVDYEIGIVFDDTRVPSAEWIPAQLFGEYFVWKQSGVIQLDGDGVPVSSGNYLAFQPSTNGGYSNLLKKTMINQAYLQFAIKTRKEP